jgi:hypothetical protein
MHAPIGTPWQKTRSAFNHDWLKNQYMPALGKYLNLIDDHIEDTEFERLFISQVLPEWEDHREEAVALARDFEREMSPRRLFYQSSLMQCDEDTKQWLGSLIHELWSRRYPVKQWVEDALSAVKQTDDAYQKLQASLQNGVDTSSAAEIRPLRDQIAALRTQCQILANAISIFPAEQRVL